MTEDVDDPNIYAQKLQEYMNSIKYTSQKIPYSIRRV